MVGKKPGGYSNGYAANNVKQSKYRFFKGNHKVKLKKGQGMIWPADYFFVHGVNTITKGCKYAVNSFLGIIQCVEMPKQSQDELNRLQTGIQQIHNETANAFKHKSSEKSTCESLSKFKED